MKSYFKVLTIVTFCTIMVSCTQTNNSKMNPIFVKFAPDNVEYKAELIKQLSLQSNTNLTFSVKDYIVENNTEKLYVTVKGNNINAIAVMLLDKPSKVLEGLRSKKGVSYHGAELKNLKYSVKGNEIVFEDVDSIVD